MSAKLEGLMQRSLLEHQSRAGRNDLIRPQQLEIDSSDRTGALSKPKINTASLSNMSDAFTRLTELCHRFDYDHFILCKPSEAAGNIKDNHVILTNFPLFVVEDICALDQYIEWSIIRAFQETCAPFKWSKSKGVDSFLGEPNSRFDDGAHLLGIDLLLEQHVHAETIHCLPMITRTNKRILMGLVSSDKQDKPLDPLLLFAAQYLYDEIERMMQMRARRSSPDISDRELECLNWAAAGKTSGEIATIVQLSEHTVNHYLNSCCKKLDCVNRTQAVATAIREQLIS